MTLQGGMAVDRAQEVRETLRALLAEAEVQKLKEYLAEVHYADLAEVLPELNLVQQIRIVRALEPRKAAEVLFELDRRQVQLLLEGLGPQRSALILREMPADDAADLLSELPSSVVEGYLKLMGAAEAEDVQELLGYEADTAGGIMTTEFVAIHEEATVEETIEAVRKAAGEAETIYYLYVVDAQNRLVGVVSLRELILARPGARIGEVMQTNVVSVNVGTDQEDVARIVAKYDFLAIPVVDHHNTLLGIVTVDDVLDVVAEESTEDFLRVSANIEEEEALDPHLNVWRRAARRLPWLVALLLGELIAGNVIQRFSDTLQTMYVLAFFMTAMAGGPGNAATQSLALVVRGLATREYGPRDFLRVVWREAQAGIVVGLVSGIVLAAAAFLWQQSALIGLVVGLALAVNIAVATTIGSLVPIMVYRLGADPALASGPFITTLMDVISMSIYFGLASVVLFYVH
ncbi:MAG: magnesium transporter [Bacillota bacterium]